MMMIYTCKRLAVLALIFGKYQVCCFIMNFVKQVARIKYYTIKKKITAYLLITDDRQKQAVTVHAAVESKMSL